MEQILGLVLVQQCFQTFKALVGWVFVIAHTPDGCMGHNHIHTAAAPQRKPQLPDPAVHFLFRILMLPRMILPAATQA